MATKRGPNIEYRDNSDLIVDALEKAINNGLTAIGMKAEGHAKKARHFNLASICFRL